MSRLRLCWWCHASPVESLEEVFEHALHELVLEEVLKHVCEDVLGLGRKRLRQVSVSLRMVVESLIRVSVVVVKGNLVRAGVLVAFLSFFELIGVVLWRHLDELLLRYPHFFSRLIVVGLVSPLFTLVLLSSVLPLILSRLVSGVSKGLLTLVHSSRFVPHDHHFFLILFLLNSN